MQTTKPRRPQPRLRRSASGTSAVSLPEIRSLSSTSPQQATNRAIRSTTTSPRASLYRSRSTSKAKTNQKDEENTPSTPSHRPSVYRSRSIAKVKTNLKENEKIITPSPRLSLHYSRSTSKVKTNQKDNENPTSGTASSRLSLYSRSSAKVKTNQKDKNENTLGFESGGLAKLKMTKILGMKTCVGSPSAWALSPGRALPAPTPESTLKPKVVESGGVSGMLKYLKPKKPNPLYEEECHTYRVMYNRLLQWRFANAKAEICMSHVNSKAQEKVFGVWLKVYKMRYGIAEKRMKVERIKQKIKMIKIINPQIEALHEWEKLEKKNIEAVSRLCRKLSALSTKLPLLDGALVDGLSLCDAMNSALEVLENVEVTLQNFYFQAEKVCYLLRELVETTGENMECFHQLEQLISTIISLEGREKSLRVQLLQSNKELGYQSITPFTHKETNAWY